MAEESIPVNLFNPGQVFACMGFLEATDVLLGDAEAAFDWSNESHVRFRLRANSGDNPFGVVLDFLAEARVTALEPDGWPGDPDDEATATECFPSPLGHHKNEKGKWTRTAFPVRITKSLHAMDLTHWADASSRNDFKLYSGNRSAATIARAMLSGTRAKPRKGQCEGDVETRGLSALWKEQRPKLETQPFDVLTPVGGSFNFDPRGGWTGIDAGYSPNDQDHDVAASPVLEILATIGLEHARPDEYDMRQVRYAAWASFLPPVLARPALAGSQIGVPQRIFCFELDLSGRNKVVTFAHEEMTT